MADHNRIVVIGAGSGGLTVALGLARLGRPVTLIEGHHVGGDCTNVGCVPSKTLIHLAKTYRPGMNVDELVQEVTRKRDALRAKETEEVEHTPNLTFIRGLATFTGPKTLTVQSGATSHVITADHIVIATGSRPRLVDIPGLPPEITLTNESLFDLTAAPKHLVIVGAGVIAVEMAFAFQKLGVRVTMFAMDRRPLATALPEVSEVIQAELKQRGITLYCGAVAKACDAGRRTLTLQMGTEAIQVTEVDKVLLAVGRVANTADLGLETVGVALDDRGRVIVDGSFQSSVAGVYAIGDVIKGPMLAHKAEEEGVACVEGIVTGYGHVNYDAIPGVCYTHPEIATVGRTEDALQQAGVAYRKGVFPFLANGRARSLGETDGKVKILADAATDRILGVHILGPRAGDLIAEAVTAIEFGASSEDLARTVHAHPTLAETVKEAALAVAGRAIHV